MTEKTTLARPYAEAAFELAQEQQRLPQWSAMLELLAAIAADRGVIALAHNPNVGPDRLLALFLDLGREVLDQYGTNFIKLILANGRLALLPEIARAFEQLKAEAENSIEVEVVSAYVLDDDQLKGLAESLKKKLGRRINLNTRVDESLIGGMLVRAGDLVIDGTVSGHLDNLASQLVH